MTPFRIKLGLMVATLAVLLARASLAQSPQAPTELNFQRDIKPLLADRCFHCHGPDEKTRQADLRLDQWPFKAGVIDANNSSGGELLNRVTSTEAHVMMPPPELNKPLTDSEKLKLQQWIAAGAKWQNHWAYEQPKRNPVATHSAQDQWSSNWIDQFIVDAMRAQGLQPSQDADSVTLLRRVCFDLTGLPPEPIVQRQWQEGSLTYAQLVDQLLRSPAFGERMAMYWLDLVRYADTVGYHGDQDQSISAYRDWVIQAFNSGMPFNEMTIQQLAGDLLPDATQQQRIATGYNRLLQTTHEGGLQPKEYRAIYAADRVRNVSAVWLAATMGCSQCHDHKFDPFTMKDFYSLSAFFADIDDEGHFKTGSNELPTRRDPELELPTSEQVQRIEQLESELKEIKQRIAHLEKASQPNPDQANKSTQDSAGITPPQQNDEVEKAQKQLKDCQTRLSAAKKQVRRSMITVALKQPRETRVLPRGNWLDESGPIVQPAFPESLRHLTSQVPVNSTVDGPQRLTRLDLARWLVDARNGAGMLTARVMVNRLWYLMFGTGIARSLDEFGNQGEPPTHPELLDQLAYHLVDSDWDLRSALRLIVCSRTYRQSSNVDAQFEKDVRNMWYSRQNALRLPAETIRDNALAVSGLLVERVGGDSARPYQPTGYYKLLNFPERDYTADKSDSQWRRGLYMHWQRQFLHPMLKAFDATNREECTAQRPRSNTPLAALTLLNDPSFIEAARVLAERLLSKPSESPQSDQAKIDQLVTTVLNRLPSQEESKVLLDLLASNREQFMAAPQAASKLTSIGLSPCQLTDRPELAAWTQVCRAVLNLAETTTRN